MDKVRFDRVARAVGRGADRRRVLGTLVGGALAGRLTWQGARARSSPIGGCFHSTGTNGGCKPACTSAGFTGAQCGVICGSGQSTGACPVGQGGGNPCCNPGYCDPANYEANASGDPVYTGPTAGCPPAS